MIYQYPFGEVSNPLVQEDRTPKKAFVLGVYASSVHARWVKNGEVICNSLPIADEPRLFWDGNEKEENEIISRVAIPEALGALEPLGNHINGPVSKVLDEDILEPLGLSRDEVWLCDCLPEPRLFPSEYIDIRDKYNPLIKDYDLNDVTIRRRPVVFCDERRAREISEELIESEAELLILLGDITIGQYLRKAAKTPYRSLEEYSEEFGYGERSTVTIRGREIEILPVAHPRQIGVYGAYNERWHKAHMEWEKKMRGEE